MASPADSAPFPTRWVLAATLLGAAFMGTLLYLNGAFWDSDEAIVGLMTRHILYKGEWPVFYWGQEYMGAVEAYLAAPFVAIFGSRPEAVKLVPLLFTVATIPIAADVGFMAAGRRFAIVTGLMFAFPALAFALWSLKTRGGFTEPAELGFWIFWASLRIARASSPRRRELWSLAAGLMLGVGLWWGEFVVPFVLSALLVLVAHPEARKLRVWALGVGGSIVGALPAIWRNAFTTNWATVQHALHPDRSQLMSGQPDHAVPAVAWENLLRIHLPAMLGFHDARSVPFHWGDPESVPGAIFVALCAIGFAIGLRRLLAPGDRLQRLAIAGPLLGGVAMGLLFVYSRFGFEREPRYVLAIWLTVATCYAWAAWIHPRVTLAGSLCVCALIAGLQIRRTFFVEPIAQLFQWNVHAYSNTSYRELAKKLEAAGITHVWADYWTAMRLNFESEEKVISTDDGAQRYPPYHDELKADPRACNMGPSGQGMERLARRPDVVRYDFGREVPGLVMGMTVVCPR